MKIIYVNKPMQDDTTIDPQIIDGKRYDWCVVSEMCKRSESFKEWWDRKQEYMLAKSKGEKLVEGIFLYNVEGIGGIPELEDDKYPWALMVRYAWIKPLKDNKKLINKWEETGLLDEVTEDFNKMNIAELMESQASILMKREWNYYFDVGTEVMLDKRMLPSEEGETFHPIKLRPYVGKVGIVKKVGSDLQAYGRGSSYFMDIEFDGELVKGIWAPNVMENLKDE